MGFEDMYQRLKEAVVAISGENIVSDVMVAKALGVTPSSVKAYKQVNRLPANRVMTFAQNNSISLDWLFYGMGEMRLPGVGSGKDYVVLGAQAAKSIGLLSRPNTRMVLVEGEEMSPTIRPGATVAVDLDQTTLKGGGVFAINVEEKVFVVRAIAKADGNIEVLPENRKYQSYTVQKDSFDVIGRVYGIIAQKL